MSDPTAVIDGGAFLLVGKSSAQEVFSDGISQVLLGYPVSRLVMHTILEPASEEAKEVRRAAVVLTMPTMTLIDTALMILRVCKQGEDQLVGFNSQQGAKISELLAVAETIDLGPNTAAQK